MSPMGPGFFIFFHNYGSSRYHGSGASFTENVGRAAFREYRKLVKEEIAKGSLEQISVDGYVLEDIPNDKMGIIDELKLKVVEKQIDQWQDAIDYIEQYEIDREATESRRLATELFKQRTQAELERRIREEEDTIAIILAIIEATHDF